ncbi:MAG: histidine kinase dimerization/phospho-acceptor domain-containing protein, partial [Desulfatiglandales bacterium]
MVFISLLLGAFVLIQVKQTKIYFGDIQNYHYFLIATIYLLTFIYVILLKRLKNLSKLAYAQLILDTFFVTAIIYATGGIESIFSFLYILTIINGSIILYRKGGMATASSSSILYGLLLDLHYYNVINPIGSRLIYPTDYQSPYFFYMIVVNIAAFYLVAFLSSYPSEQARKSRVELRAKQNDIVELEAINEWIVRSITSGLITLDSQNKVILFNPAAEDIFAIKASQAIGNDITDILPFLDDHIGNGKKGSFQYTRTSHKFVDLPFTREDDKKIFLRFFISPLRLPDGEQKGQILFFQDMTEIKRIEEEMKKVEGLALIGELAAGVAHEIRNPLASISGSIEMLKEGLDKSDVSNKLMEIILREMSRLNNLVKDFLLFARPNQAKLKKFDLNQLILDSLELFKNSGNWTEKMRVETTFREDIELESDPEQIKQVFWNLFLNATEAMPDGGSLHIRTDLVNGRDLPEKGRTMGKITVRDTGQGFSKRALSHVFTPFFTTKEG